MHYKLYNDPNPFFTPLQQILYNRGIDLDKQESWLEPTKDELIPWRELGPMIDQAMEKVHKCIKDSGNMVLVVDCDTDGYTASAILINFFYKAYPQWASKHLSWVHHKGKTHGLADVIDQALDMSPDLILVPDAGSNDIEQHKQLDNLGIECVILDHHDVDQEIVAESPATIVNVQINDYSNKSLTGAGVAFKFIRGFNEIYLCNTIDTDFWLDLCTIGNVGDMADYKQPEIRALVKFGLKEFHNPFLAALAQKNHYILEKRNGVNYLSCSFAIVPFLNSITRSAEDEEKNLVFNALLDHMASTKVASSKRGQVGKMVPLVEEALVVADRVKRRQTKLEEAGIEKLVDQLTEKGLDKNAVLIFLCDEQDIAPSLAGLVANIFQGRYQKPTMVLRKRKRKNKVFYVGSMRNYSLSPFQDFKSILEQTGKIEWCQGHANAAGCCVLAENIDALTEALNERYKDIDNTPTYWVDYVYTPQDIDAKDILTMGRMDIFGQGVPETKVVLRDLPIDKANVTLMSPDKNPTLKITCGPVSCIKFRSSQEEYDYFVEANKMITLVGKPSVNEWNGTISAQILIDDFILEEDDDELSWEDF